MSGVAPDPPPISRFGHDMSRCKCGCATQTTTSGGVAPDPLDRIAHKLQGTMAALTLEEAKALVEVARAARRAERKLKYEYDRLSKRDGYQPPDDESWAEGEMLAAALARLDKQAQP